MHIYVLIAFFKNETNTLMKFSRYVATILQQYEFGKKKSATILKTEFFLGECIFIGTHSIHVQPAGADTM